MGRSIEKESFFSFSGQVFSKPSIVAKRKQKKKKGGGREWGKKDENEELARLARLESDVDVQETDRILKDWESVGGIRMGGEGRR